jgi:hypothetical protein
MMSVAHINVTHICQQSGHSFIELQSNNGRIFCTRCGEFRGDVSPDVGLICLWSGEVATILPGWQLCDGTNGTPDLRDKFIVGGGGGYTPGSTGGSIHSKLALENIPSHTHDRNSDKNEEVPIIVEILQPGSSSNGCVVAETKTAAKDPYCKVSGCRDFPNCCDYYQRKGHEKIIAQPLTVYPCSKRYSETGAGGSLEPKPFDTRPPYYALAYIMRMN